MVGKKGAKHYSVETKLEAVRMFFEEGLTRAEIAKVLGLRRAERVKIWTKQYRQKGMAAFTQPLGRPRKVVESEAEELARLRMEKTLLKKYHSQLRKEMLTKRNIGSSINTEKNLK